MKRPGCAALTRARLAQPMGQPAVVLHKFDPISGQFDIWRKLEKHVATRGVSGAGPFSHLHARYGATGKRSEKRSYRITVITTITPGAAFI